MGLVSDKLGRVLLIGNAGVGKSSIILQFTDGRFNYNYYNTIGVDYVPPSPLRRSNSSPSATNSSNYKS